MGVVVVILVVVGVAIAFLIGLGTGSSLNPPSVERPGEPKADANCADACARWDNARQMQCNAKSDEAAARSRADGIRGQMLATLAAATTLAVAGAAALAAAAAATATIFGIPAGIVLTGVAIGLFVLAAAALAAAAIFTGQLVAAESDVNDKAATRRAWDTEVANARSAVNASCPIDAANACLSRAPPC